MDARSVYSGPTDRGSGVICDQRVMLNGFYSAKNYPDHLRRIRFRDPESGKTMVFLTSNTTLPALTIAAVYKSRWQVELSQGVPAHQAIPGCQRERSEDANLVRRLHYVLIAIVKKEPRLDASLYTCVQILLVSSSRKPRFRCVLQPDRSPPEPPDRPNQLILFAS